jgi:hypothetical protein
MDRQHILSEIRRMAVENDGIAPGSQRFESETHIRETDWGRYWARWGDALTEAGCKPNDWQQKIPSDALLENLAVFVRELGRFPVLREMRLKSLRDKFFPSKTTFRRFGTQQQLATRLHEYCLIKGYGDVAGLCEAIAIASTESELPVIHSRGELPLGFVYLIKSGRYYKIGRSNAVGRRERELDILLPDPVKVIHSMKTDDPPGIEDYWHRRFADRRKKGEWFELTAIDVAVFRRRKFM